MDKKRTITRRNKRMATQIIDFHPSMLIDKQPESMTKETAQNTHEIPVFNDITINVNLVHSNKSFNDKNFTHPAFLKNPLYIPHTIETVVDKPKTMIDKSIIMIEKPKESKAPSKLKTVPIKFEYNKQKPNNCEPTLKERTYDFKSLLECWNSKQLNKK